MTRTQKLFAAVLSAVLSLALATGAVAAPVAGRASGVGTDFVVSDSLGQPYTISSTDAVALAVLAVATPGEMALTIDLEPSAAVVSTILTVRGLVPNREYHVYIVNELVSHSLIPAGADGSLSLSVNLQEPCSIRVKTSPSTYYVGQGSAGGQVNECDSIGVWYPNGMTGTCMLNRNVVGTIVVWSGNTLDGNGFSLTVPASAIGVDLSNRNSVTVKNLTIIGGAPAIKLYSSGSGLTAGKILENTVTGCSVGLGLGTNSQTTVERNTFDGCAENIYISSNIGYSTFTGNKVLNGNPLKSGIHVGGGGGNTFKSNTISNNPGGGVNVVSGNNLFADNAFDNWVLVNGALTSINVKGTQPATWNLGEGSGPNIIGGPHTGGNYWAGYSDSCTDTTPKDGFCDAAFSVVDPGGLSLGSDEKPLTYIRNSAPLLVTGAAAGEVTGRVGDELKIDLSAIDPDSGDTLTFSAAQLTGGPNLPAAFTFDPVGGVFLWTPLEGQNATYEITFCVSDNGDPMLEDCEDVSIVIDANRPPTVSAVTPLTAPVDAQATFPVTISDPDNDNIIARWAENLPSGASFNSNGIFSWFPQASDSGTSYTVTFCAQDDGVPTLTTCFDVVISVPKVDVVVEPTKLAEDLANEVVARALAKDVQNSYLANLKKVSFFISEGKVGAAVNQLQAFVHKVGQDVLAGKVLTNEADAMTAQAGTIIALLSPTP